MMMIFRPTLILILVAHLALAALADQLLDNVVEAENQARAVLGFVLEAPRSPDVTVSRADAAREQLKALISSLVTFKEALQRHDSSWPSAYNNVVSQNMAWRQMRESLQYTETEREFLVRMDDIMDVVDQDTAQR